MMKEYQEIKLDDDPSEPVNQDYGLKFSKYLSTFAKTCINIPEGTSVKICNEGGNMMAIFEPKEVKKEELKDSLPNTWEEFCKQHPIHRCEEYYIRGDSNIRRVSSEQDRAVDYDRNFLPSEKSAKSHLALMQLERLRNCYRNGWEPDWNNKDIGKYVIHNSKNKIGRDVTYTWSRFLSFQTLELRDKFFDNFKDLIEVAKELI